MNAKKRLAEIHKKIAKSKSRLKAIRDARRANRSPIRPQKGAHAMLKSLKIAPVSFNLLAQGDSWFDYLPGRDLIDYLRDKHGHKIENIGVGGSTLNDIVYGPVPKNWLGVPQSDDVDRISELISQIQEVRPRGLLLSGGGNDIAGAEFFSFLNNAKSGLRNPNLGVLRGALDETFADAYRDVIAVALAESDNSCPGMKIFVHGYDYPWPDGRSVFIFNLVGPWFHDTFNKKNFPYAKQDAAQLHARYEVTKAFMDAFNGMLQGLEAEFDGRVFHVDLRNTLKSRGDWANELHPTNAGFEALADKFNAKLHQHMAS
jgi:lysophospholipase L1-like esterase